jgi:hypothetical protein
MKHMSVQNCSSQLKGGNYRVGPVETTYGRTWVLYATRNYPHHPHRGAEFSQLFLDTGDREEARRFQRLRRILELRPAMAGLRRSHLFVASPFLFAFFSSVRSAPLKGETVQTGQDAPTELIFRHSKGGVSKGYGENSDRGGSGEGLINLHGGVAGNCHTRQN